MSECCYCGNDHAPAELCQARRVNRRSFFGVFAAGLAGLALAPQCLTWKDRLWEAGKWDDTLGVDPAPGDAFVAYYTIRRLPDGSSNVDWLDRDGRLLTPDHDLAPSGRFLSGRLTSIPTRD